MKQRWKSYVLVHVCLLAVAALFALYAWIIRLFPSDTFHCLLHDLFRLYCPFCGGTRGFRALLSLRLAEAMRLCGDLILAALLALALDIRALVLLCCKREGRFLPPLLLPVTVGYFSLTLVLRNTLLLMGYDPIGDLLVYWQARTSLFLAFGFFVLSLAMLVSFYIAVGILPSFHIPRKAAGLGASAALVSLAALLYTPWLLLGLVPLALATPWLFQKRRGTP